MKKLIALILLVSMLACLVSCDLFNKGADDKNNDNSSGDINAGVEDGKIDENVGGNPTDDPNARYLACLAIDSYDELLSGRQSAKETLGRMEQSYTFDGGVSEKYSTVYYFEVPNAWVTYPISADDFFSKYGSRAVNSYLFITDGEKCGIEGHGRGHLFANVGDDYYALGEYPYITVEKSGSQTGDSLIEIEDTTLVTLNRQSNVQGVYSYYYNYDGESAFVIRSCVELSDSELAYLIEHIVIV